MPVHDESCDCFVCKAKTVSFGSVPGGTRRTRVLKEREMPRAPSEDAWGQAPAKHGGVPLLHEDGSSVTLREQQHNRSSIKKRLAAAKVAGTIKE